MAQNVEIKARVESLETIRNLVQPHVTDSLGTQNQVDTYFNTPRGRLKIRQIDGQSGQLIWYLRPDATQARISHYSIIDPVPKGLFEVLAEAYGRRIRVVKRREILLHHNVRIHLDEVESLGTFIELEGVIGDFGDEEISRKRVVFLCEVMKLSPNHYVETSYGELLGGLD